MTEHLIELKQTVSRFPTSPGVYVMRDEGNEVIYVGKAKDLRSRVRSYFGTGDERIQIEYLLKRVRVIESIGTSSEEEAFVLERDLIQRYKPRYNIRLKDDKAFYQVRIDLNEEWPRIELVRKSLNDGAIYFGPFPSSLDLKSLLEVIRRVVPLRTCTNTVFYNRQRPCLEYQIKRCAGPCCLPVDREEYRNWVTQAISILEGKNKEIIVTLNKDMDLASEDLRFEDAAAIRDRITVLEQHASGKRPIRRDGSTQDVFSLFRDGSFGTLVVMNIQDGRVFDSKVFELKDLVIPDGEIIESSITQYYEGAKEMPDEIIIPFDLENGELISFALSERKGEKVSVLYPKKGSKAALLKLGALNASQAYTIRFDQEHKTSEIAKSLSVSLKLSQVPRRIECVDISNFQGSDIVGANVSFFDGVPDKSGYRHYNITAQGKPDDFASIYEVVSRRLKRGKEEESLPDLLIIDGGEGQLRSALKAREDSECKIDIVALAKAKTSSDLTSEIIERSEERVFIEGQKDPIIFPSTSEVTHFLERIRDEVHRFVITFHRKKRSKRVVSSKLEKIPGISPERRGRLLKAFGSIEALKRANPDEIAKAGRMPKSLALKLLKILGV